MAETYPALSYSMGFKIDNSPIPNPMGFSGAVSDLDSMGERDATGLLHRDRVATKHPLKMEYKNITWDLVTSICSKMRNDSFQFTYPDPVDGLITITAYVGDREWEDVWSPEDEVWLAHLKFSVIEY